jgi:hypothetical protein
VLKQYNPCSDQAEKWKRTIGPKQNKIGYDWHNEDEENFGCRNLTEEEIAQQAEEDEQDEKKEETCAKLKFSGVKQNFDSIISFVDCNPQYNKYYLMLREMRLDVVKEQYKRGTRSKISSCFKCNLNNTKYGGYLKCF